MMTLSAQSQDRIEKISKEFAAASIPEETQRLAGQLEALRGRVKLLEYFQRVETREEAVRAIATIQSHHAARKAHNNGYFQEMDTFLREVLTFVRDAPTH